MRSGRTSSPIWVMCRGVVGPKFLVDETGAMTKTVPPPVLPTRGAARFGQDGEMVIRGTSQTVGWWYAGALALGASLPRCVPTLSRRG